jgi:hypothetical protein
MKKCPLKEIKYLHNFIGTVSTFVILIYFGSGTAINYCSLPVPLKSEIKLWSSSATGKSYGFYGSGFATLAFNPVNPTSTASELLQDLSLFRSGTVLLYTNTGWVRSCEVCVCAGMRESLTEVISKSLSKLATQSEGGETVIDETLLS